MSTRSLSQGFEIITHMGPIDACAKFWYKGIEVSFSSLGYSKGSCLNEINLYDHNDKLLHQVRGTVEDAIDWINDNSIEFTITYFKDSEFDASVDIPYHDKIKTLNEEIAKHRFNESKIGYLWSIDNN